jgi:hypothetical protein
LGEFFDALAEMEHRMKGSDLFLELLDQADASIMGQAGIM